MTANTDEDGTAQGLKRQHVAALLFLVAAVLWFVNAALSSDPLLGLSLGAMFLALANMNYQMGKKTRKQGN